VCENTNAGNQCAGLVAQALDYLGLQSYRADLPLGLNLSSYMQRCVDKQQALNELISRAYPFRQTMESVQGDIHVS